MKNKNKLKGILQGFVADLLFWIYFFSSLYFLMHKWFQITFPLIYVGLIALIVSFLFFLIGDSIGRKIFFGSKKTKKKWKKCFWGWFVIVALVLTFVVGWNIVEVKPYKFFTQFKNAKGIASGIFDPSIIGYQLTEKSLKQYKEHNLPENIIAECEKIKYKKFATRNVFFKKLGLRVGKSGFDEFKSIFLKYAEKGTEVVINNDDFINIQQIGNITLPIINATKILIGKRFTNPYDFSVELEGKIGEFEIEKYKSIINKYAVRNTKLLDQALAALAETIFLALLATVFAIPFAFVLSFIAARNLMPKNFIGNTVYLAVRTIATIFRSIEAIVWAIIFCVWVGIGPFAGMLALMIHSMAALTKLYSEQIENIDSGPIEAMKATGANTLQVWLYAVIPQIISPYLAFTIYRWDINVRMATIVGFVGGGGIGFLLLQNQQLLRWHNVGLLIWLIAFVVWVMDMVSAKVREKLQSI